MTPEEIAREEEKRKAFKQWAGGMFERMQYGGAPHFDPNTGQYVRNQGGLSVTKVGRLPERTEADVPPMERPTHPYDGPPEAPEQEAPPQAPTPQELETYQPPDPAPSEPEEPSDAAAPAEEEANKEQVAQANQKGNATFKNYMKLFSSPRRR